MNYKDYIKIVEGFPEEGISFKDITPLLQDGKVFQSSINDLSKIAKELGATVVVGPESRGFIFGCPVATNLGVGFVPLRKPGKLPREAITEEYALEYGTNTLCMHKDAIKENDKVVIIDDLLATGGTVKAAINLIKKCKAEVVGCLFLIELEELKGRALLEGTPIYTLMSYKH